MRLLGMEKNLEYPVLINDNGSENIEPLKCSSLAMQLLSDTECSVQL